MGMSNAEKQASWRTRHKQRVAELEAEVARLKARVAELEQAKPQPAPELSRADRLKLAKRNWQWMPLREIEECIKAARGIAAEAHPDRGGSHEAAAAANKELEAWRSILARRREMDRKAAEEKAERRARSKAAWAKRRAAG